MNSHNYLSSLPSDSPVARFTFQGITRGITREQAEAVRRMAAVAVAIVNGGEFCRTSAPGGEDQEIIDTSRPNTLYVDLSRADSVEDQIKWLQDRGQLPGGFVRRNAKARQFPKRLPGESASDAYERISAQIDVVSAEIQAAEDEQVARHDLKPGQEFAVVVPGPEDDLEALYDELLADLERVARNLPKDAEH